MDKELLIFSPIAKAIGELLYPHAEIVIHDLRTGKIAQLYNNLSKRSPGDESLLEELKVFKEIPDVFPPYFKTNWDGRQMKSVSATLRNAMGKPIGLLCINLDLSKWEEFYRFVQGWLEGMGTKAKPELLFHEDWREKINAYVSDYLKREGLLLKNLSKDQKQQLVKALHREGAFKAKNAASYVADVLKISRATIYNYLR